MTTECFDVIVIGGGLLGCFTARALTRYKLKTALLERREDVCTGISRANTAIVYSGCDTKPGTLKTSLCVKAAQGFAELCESLGVRYSQCGSIMVCFGERGEAVLRRKYQNGLENGVRGIRLLTRDEVLELEPNLDKGVRAGLYAPDAGTANPWELCIAAAENAVKNGAELMLNTEVTAIEIDDGGYKIIAGDRTFFARGIVNCAGLMSDKVFEMAETPSVRISPSAGDYYVLDIKAEGHIKHVVFHEPEEKGKGLTLVPTVDGNILIGPTELPESGREAFATAGEGLQLLDALVNEVMPSLPMEHVIRSFGAVRPNPQLVQYDTVSGDYILSGKSVNDFCITVSESATPFISLVGIKTPGFTCANELGEYVSDKIALLLQDTTPNPAFEPRRKMPVRLKGMAANERVELVRKNPAYGRIVCRCGEVSEGEIVDAIRTSPGAVTVHGVKRRAGACMGRCQGGFCTQRVIELLASETGRAPEEITKDGEGSFILRGIDHGHV